jgi:DNA-binding MarR family transcriptional regulator
MPACARADDPDLPCACTSLRKAARAVARHYEEHLGRAGVTATQFAILRALERARGPRAMSRLAEDLVMDRTSLYRAVTPLLSGKLVAFAGAPDGRTKTLVLTGAGRRRIARALPRWREAQAGFLGRIGTPRWRSLAPVLAEVVARVQGRSGS